MKNTFFTIKRLQDGMIEFVRSESHANPMWITLMMKKAVDGLFIEPFHCSKSVRRFQRVLAKRLLGSERKYKLLPMFPCIEKNRCERYHIHILADRPENVSAVEFDAAVRSAWLSLPWSYHNIDVQAVYKEEPLWTYFAKQRTKGSDFMASFDLENTNRKVNNNEFLH